VHEIVGVQLQAGALPPKLRVGEILRMYRSFYRDPADVGELTVALGLTAKHHDYYRSLSGGQRQRLSVALALIGQPKIAAGYLLPADLPRRPMVAAGAHARCAAGPQRD
jgi:ABC-2 type transport system ATP-binding protein